MNIDLNHSLSDDLLYRLFVFFLSNPAICGPPLMIRHQNESWRLRWWQCVRGRSFWIPFDGARSWSPSRVRVRRAANQKVSHKHLNFSLYFSNFCKRRRTRKRAKFKLSNLSWDQEAEGRSMRSMIIRVTFPYLGRRRPEWDQQQQSVTDHNVLCLLRNICIHLAHMCHRTRE